LSLLPLSISLFFAAPFSALLLKKFTAKRIIQSGLVINLAGIITMRSSISTSANTNDLALGMILFGIGMGFVMAQINNLTLSAVSVQQAGEASGVNNTIRQIGASLGSAIIGAVLLTALATNIANGINASKAIPERFKSRISDSVSANSSEIEFGAKPKLDPLLLLTQPKLVSEIKSITDSSTTDAVKTALTYSIMFGTISIMISMWLPNVKNLERDENLAPKRH
jgi:MFS family permease